MDQKFYNKSVMSDDSDPCLEGVNFTSEKLIY